jgi:hypothetical protein
MLLSVSAANGSSAIFPQKNSDHQDTNENLLNLVKSNYTYHKIAGTTLFTSCI